MMRGRSVGDCLKLSQFPQSDCVPGHAALTVSTPRDSCISSPLRTHLIMSSITCSSRVRPRTSLGGFCFAPTSRGSPDRGMTRDGIVEGEDTTEEFQIPANGNARCGRQALGYVVDRRDDLRQRALSLSTSTHTHAADPLRRFYPNARSNSSSRSPSRPRSRPR